MLIELSLTRRKRQELSSETAFNRLISLGIDPLGIVESDRKSHTRISMFLKPSEAAKFEKRLRKLGPRGWTVSSRQLENKDWLTKWQQAFDIAPVGRRFVIVPLWKKTAFARKKSVRTPLLIDPQGSFGSGTHATTRLVIETLESLKPQPKNFLDVGTGTGVLLVAAGKLGISNLCGTDNDPRALKTARHNLELNGLKARLLKADAVTMKRLEPFEAVAANLLSKTLVDSRRTLAAMTKRGGTLIVSGIEKRNLNWFLRNFKIPGLRKRSVQVRGGWSAVVFKKFSG